MIRRMRDWLEGFKNRSKTEDASEMRAGDRHYRAWVGPPKDYDVIGASQVSLLIAAGLRETHKLCDVGCGSLRGGRMLIPYLLPGNYHGIEPDKKMLKDGIAHEIGRDLVKLKRPTFLHGTDFPLAEFGVEFDFVLAQSIWSHTYPGLMRDGFQKVESALAEEGMMLATYREGDPVTREAGGGWLYPGVVPYRWHQVERILGEAGLIGRALDWTHPYQVWFVASRPERKKEVSDLARRIRPPLA